MGSEPYKLRVACADDSPAIESLMKRSAAALSNGFYSEAQIPSVVQFIARLDPVLIVDGTYFVIEDRLDLVACGGWSRRDKLFSGPDDIASGLRMLDPQTEPARVRAMFVDPRAARRGLGKMLLDACVRAASAECFLSLELMATLPGIPLYVKYGFAVVEPSDLILPDGCIVGGAKMRLECTDLIVQVRP